MQGSSFMNALINQGHTPGESSVDLDPLLIAIWNRHLAGAGFPPFDKLRTAPQAGSLMPPWMTLEQLERALAQRTRPED